MNERLELDENTMRIIFEFILNLFKEKGDLHNGFFVITQQQILEAFNIQFTHLNNEVLINILQTLIQMGFLTTTNYRGQIRYKMKDEYSQYS